MFPGKGEERPASCAEAQRLLRCACAFLSRRAQALSWQGMEAGTVADGRHGGNVWDGGGPEQWLDFSANLRPEGPPEWVMQAMKDALGDTRYYPDRSMTAARRARDMVIPAMQACRVEADALERLVDDAEWSLPKYQELLWMH